MRTRLATDTDILVNMSRRLVFLGMFLLPLLSIRVGKSLSVSDAIFAVAAILLALSVRPPVRRRPVSGWVLGAFLVVIGGLLSSFGAVSPYASLVVVGNGVYVMFALQWTTRHVLTDTRLIHKAMAAFVLGTSLSAAVAIIQTKFHALGYQGSVAGAEGARALGLARQPDIAAVTYGLALVFALGLALQLGPGRRWWRVAAVAVLAVALIGTGSVSGMACALIGTVVLLVRRGIKIHVLVVTAIAVVSIYTVATSLQHKGSGENLNPFARIAQTTGHGTGYNTVNPRIATWKAATDGIIASPVIGHGLDLQSSLVYFDPSLLISYPTHNLPLLLWYQGGILFLFGFAIMMASAVRRLMGPRRDPTRDIVLAGAVVVLAFSMQSPEMFDRWLWLPFLLAMTFRGEQATPQTRPLDTAGAAVPPEPFDTAGSANPTNPTNAGSPTESSPPKPLPPKPVPDHLPAPLET